MRDAAALVPIEEREVEFYGDRLVAGAVVGQDGESEILISFARFARPLGLGWSAQFRRIQRDPVLAAGSRSVDVTATEADGRSDMFCLTLEFLPRID